MVEIQNTNNQQELKPEKPEQGQPEPITQYAILTHPKYKQNTTGPGQGEDDSIIKTIISLH